MPADQQKKKILVVDDEPHVVAYLEMLLKDNGYETVSADNGEDGLAQLRKEKPDLVTLDISMPETSGVRFYKEVKSDPDFANVPIVIVTAVTGYAGDPYGYMKFISSRSNVPPPEGFFPKPIDKEEFLAAIQKLLSSS